MDPQLHWSDHAPSTRSASPSPSVSPSRAVGATYTDSRCLATPPQLSSSVSSRSVSSASESGLSHGRRRGYVRPQGTTFSASAKNRDSVMSLGSIAHMQYYFARTGLLDGRGAQFASNKDPASKQEPGSEVAVAGGSYTTDGSDLPWTEGQLDHIDSTISPDTDGDTAADMLPPTVSTYRVKPLLVAPPPDMTQLRSALKSALLTARSTLQDIETGTCQDPPEHEAQQAWHDVQGLHVLDVLTLAIRSAKDYYTFHDDAQTLYLIKSEKDIRSELHHALDILKRMANRNFRDGIREDERTGLLTWLDSITSLLRAERDLEVASEAQRASWLWLRGDWTGKERDREHQFLSSFLPSATILPSWQPATDEATPFLRALSAGLVLIQLHNEFVAQSSRHFGAITTFHTDLGKPYRCADNLRYWLKAAELRWEAHLKVNVPDVVYSRGERTWRDFDAAVLTWSRMVREELTAEWERSPTRPGTAGLRSRAGTQTATEQDTRL